jgi:hypothetical protein
VKIDPRSAKIVATFPLSVPTDHLAIAGSSLWATSANVVMQIDPSNGHILSRLTFRDPCELLATDQGIWVSSCQGPDLPDKLMRIDPASGRVVYRVPLGDSGPMVFTDGQLWLALWARDHFELQARAPDTGKPTGSALNVTPGPHPWGAIGMLGPPRAFMAIGAGSFWLTHVDEADVVRVRLGGSGAK